MIVPSIDLMQGRAVQLRRGRDLVLDGGDPLARLEQFAVAGEVAVVDLDAALGKGSNAGLIREMVRRAPCRVGGGIRDLDTARAWLDAGATRIVVGTAASPDFCGALPRDRVIAAVDADRGQVVVEGWRTATGASVLDRIRALAPVAGGFLFTQVENEGAMGGFDFQAVAAAVRAAGDARVTAAGGITTATEIAELDRIGADAQVGMALYTGRLSLGDAVAAPLAKPVDSQGGGGGGGVWPTVVCDEWGHTLGLVWSTRESLARAIAERRGIYWSRSRQALWEKGATSGNTQALVRVDLAPASATWSGGPVGHRGLISTTSLALSRNALPGRSRDREPRNCSRTPGCSRPSCGRRPRSWGGPGSALRWYTRPPTCCTSLWSPWCAAAARWRTWWQSSPAGAAR